VTWFHNLSIGRKLSIFMLTINIVLLLLVSQALVTNEYFRVKQNLGNDLMTLADIMSTNSSIGLAFDDEQTTRDILKSLKAKPNIIMAHIFNNKGYLFASYLREDIDPEMLPQAIEDYDNTGLIQIMKGREIRFQEGFVFQLPQDRAYVLKQIFHDGRFLGGIFIQSDLKEFNFRLRWYISTLLVIMGFSLGLVWLLAARLQQIITKPVYHLRDTMGEVGMQKNYSLRAEKVGHDEIGQLIDGFNSMLEKIEERDRKIGSLNDQLQEENRRMSMELEVTCKLQQMVLPTPHELKAIEGLDIAGYMLPADEVGGDYYDVLYHNGTVKIGIGDVTGHGLESGVVMLMVQMAVRTLLANQVTHPETFLAVLNQAVFDNIQRMHSDKSLTLTLLDYREGRLYFTGQHEEVLVFRHDGRVERFNTTYLGFVVGLLPDIRRFLSRMEIYLEIGDGIVLYTDGITEAQNLKEEFYGIERLCETVCQAWYQDATTIQQMVIADVQQFVGEKKLLDDITLLVVKRTT